MDNQNLQLIAMGQPYMFLNKQYDGKYALYLLIPVFEGLSIKRVDNIQEVELSESNKEIEIEFDICHPSNGETINYNNILFKGCKIDVKLLNDAQDLIFPSSSNGVPSEGNGAVDITTSDAVTITSDDEQNILLGYKIGAKINSPNKVVRKFSLSLAYSSNIKVTEYESTVSDNEIETPKNQVIACNCPYFFPLTTVYHPAFNINPKLLIPLQGYKYIMSSETLQIEAQKCSSAITLIEDMPSVGAEPTIAVPMLINEHQLQIDNPEQKIRFEIEVSLGNEVNAKKSKVKSETKPADTF
ncbi:MAG: hypothetical protein MI974_17110 [Chitinophagales bacterium]|nr:hypothetical protein [Chitinophagales bacterium]